MINGDTIVKKAREYIGYPYIYGGSSPSSGGFDCSGLAQYVYKQVGINIPRTTYDQIKTGIKITSKAALEKGDLIFNLDSKGIAQHVMIYSGNGNVIEAQTQGTLVSENSYWKWDGIAVRILNSTMVEPSISTKLIYRVIAGSYSDKNNAIVQQNSLTKKGYASFIAIYNDNNKILYRVVVGSYTSKENAIDRQNQLLKSGVNSFILEYRS